MDTIDRRSAHASEAPGDTERLAPRASATPSPSTTPSLTSAPSSSPSPTSSPASSPSLTPSPSPARPGLEASRAWIDERFGLLDPPDAWEPSPSIALATFRARVDAEAEAEAAAPSFWRPWASWRFWRSSRRSSLWLPAAAVVGCLVLVMMLPATRAVAQRLWDVIWVGRLEVVSLDTSRLPASLTATTIRGPEGVRPVATPAEAAQLAGFVPRLPTSPMLPGTPKLTVMGPFSFGSTVNAADLRAALAAAGIGDLTVPQEWDGAKLVAHIGHQVIVEYPEITFTQSRPLALTTPPGFDFRGFTEVALRLAGLRPAEARTFSLQLADNPALLLPVAPDEQAQVRLRQVRLRTGIGTLLHDLSDEGKSERVTLMWSVPDRLYLVSAGTSDDVVIALANSIE